MLKGILTAIWSVFIFFISEGNDFVVSKIEENLEVRQISKSVYIHISYMESENFGRFPSNGLIFIDNGKAVIIDTPVNNDLANALMNWCIDSLHVEIIAVIPTHWHVDNLGGLAAVHSRGIPTYANIRTIEITKEKSLLVPQNAFNDSLLFTVGDKEVLMAYYGGGHTTDNIIVWIPSEKVLFGGCLVRSANARGLGNTTDADTEEWPNTIEKVRKRFLDAEIVIPGHGEHGGTELIDHTLDLFN
ncbi:MAG: subclass B1 metallo-beta-lactamase [Bacteroidales bacterium]|nr:subclass B1 metallo-beta-lactamase [Bacteroidales bacterium]